MRNTLLCLCAALPFLGCSHSADPPASPTASFPAAADIIASYDKLELKTKEPVFVDPALAMLCRGATQAEVETARKASGPHAHTMINVYMNALAADAFRRSATPFPAGSVIVKEKKALHHWPADGTRQRTKPHDGVGGMIKRPAGHDPQNGDWTYFYSERSDDHAKFEAGAIASCVQCHANAADKDHVFGGWAAARRR
jgi:hypothetical protein